ncbi:MAG: carboxypeptidase-like regulatory domain-containing protein [Bacteroidetes bacterium]|nr:carboxypeptidase-like regulatory domain-containing protein [Bacteroidota bacterium]
MKRISLILIGLLYFVQSSLAQEKSNSEHFIQLSGIVVDDDSLRGIPFVSVIVKGTKRGTITDFYGFFSVVAQPGDELQFFSINHKNAVYKLEDTLSLKHYYVIQRLLKDTILLADVDVYPWPSKEEFKKAFLNLDLSETDYDRAAKNLDRNDLSYAERNLKMDAQANYRYAMQQYLTKVYTTGQYPVNNLLNPIAWAQFIDAWRQGKFKKKSNTKK